MILKIRDYREELNLTQKELAEKISNVQRNVSNWENGASEPDCETILKLSTLFDVSIDELFGREYIPTEKPSASGMEIAILKQIKRLSDEQKYALLQFLRETNNQ